MFLEGQNVLEHAIFYCTLYTPISVRQWLGAEIHGAETFVALIELERPRIDSRQYRIAYCSD